VLRSWTDQPKNVSHLTWSTSSWNMLMVILSQALQNLCIFISLFRFILSHQPILNSSLHLYHRILLRPPLPIPLLLLPRPLPLPLPILFPLRPRLLLSHHSTAAAIRQGGLKLSNSRDKIHSLLSRLPFALNCLALTIRH